MRVLYAEDEKQMSVAVAEILRMEGFEVVTVYDGAQAWDEVQKGYFDAVILDVMMPELDGFEVLRLMREADDHTAVMMLTAKAAVEDRVAGLSGGADDYLGKPFAMKELVARLDALVRRSNDYRHASVEIANVTLDGETGELKTPYGSLHLNNVEAELFAYFVRHPNSAYTAEEINDIVWKGGESAEKAELYIFYLRNKLRQIHADVNFAIVEGTYELGEHVR